MLAGLVSANPGFQTAVSAVHNPGFQTAVSAVHNPGFGDAWAVWGEG